MPSPALLAETTRRLRDGRELVESRHHGHLVVVGPDGRALAVLGDPEHVAFARSTVKPFQATASLELADHPELPAASVAVGWASHRGESDHLQAVTAILDRAALSPDDLTTPTTTPASDPCAPASRLAHNCSGKHALFALAGRQIGCRGERLLDPDSQVQRHVLATVADGVGTPTALSVDGCGAPAVAVRLSGLARGYLALATGTSRWQRVVHAGLAHPEMIGGRGRLESALLAAGVVAKPGAEGMFAAGWTDQKGEPRAAALKVGDGAARAAAAALHGLLAAAGVIDPDIWQPAAVLGGSQPVGSVRASRAVQGSLSP